MTFKVGDSVKIIRPLSIKLDVSDNKNKSFGIVTEVEMKEARVQTSKTPNNKRNWESFTWLSKRNGIKP
jgi:hypothetical protein